jgi:hypothetical protein
MRRRLGCFDAQRHLVGDANAVAFERDDFFWMIGQNSDVGQSEIDEDLRADAAFVLDHALTRGFAVELAAPVKMNLRQPTRRIASFDAKAAPGVMEVEKNTAAFLGDRDERARDKLGAIAGDRAENIAGEAVRVDADERWIRPFEIAADQGDVLVLIDVARVGNHSEIAVACGEDSFGDAADVALVLHAVADEVGYREHLHVVLAAEFMQLRDARHRPVFVHDFADDGGRIEAGDASEIDAGFSLPSADEHPSIAGAQRENMPGPREILRPSLGIDGGEDGDRAVGRADASRDAKAPVDRFRERSAVHRRVDRRHKRQMKLVAAVFGERQADQPARILRHEVDRLWRDFLGGQRQVAFVLAVFIVDEDNHASLADVFDGLFNRGEFGLVGHSKKGYQARLVAVDSSPRMSQWWSNSAEAGRPAH